ncbi:MAG: hypothetical protein GYB68_03825 [Chloroflexi bacterium]|nr:hypothetical protein [Chloroflexota bacterium]
MKIAITSDIHYQQGWHTQIERLAEMLRDDGVELMIMAGDTGEPLDMFSKGLEIFSVVCQKRAALTGNHDVWHRPFLLNSQHTSQELWDTQLKTVANAQGYTWLDYQNMVIDSLGICGTLAWYDYSGKSSALDFSDDEYEQMKPMISNDGRFITWGWTDRQFAQKISAEFLERLDALERDPKVTDILVVTHVPLFREATRYFEFPEQGVADAYYANATLGESVLTRKKVRAIVSGHVHRDTDLEVPTDHDHTIRAYTIPADYGKPAAVVIDTESWTRRIVRSVVEAIDE